MIQIEDVIIDLTMAGIDRGALVRPAQQGKQVGVMVLMTSGAAVSRLGVALRPVCESLGTEPGMKDGVLFDGRPGRDLSLKSTIDEMFGDCDESPRGWLIFTLSMGKMVIIGIIFVGTICEKVAALCCEHGAPCSLDPDRAAPGYEIVERRNRA